MIHDRLEKMNQIKNEFLADREGYVYLEQNTKSEKNRMKFHQMVIAMDRDIEKISKLINRMKKNREE